MAFLAFGKAAPGAGHGTPRRAFPTDGDGNRPAPPGGRFRSRALRGGGILNLLAVIELDRQGEQPCTDLPRFC